MMAAMIDTDDSWPPDMTSMARKAAVDALVGSRLRLCRELLGWTLQDMAGVLGRDAVLLGEYEAGRVRVSPVDLTEIAGIFQIPVIWFFVGLPGPDDRKENAARARDDRAAALSAAEEIAVDEHLALFAKELSRIQDPSIRIMLVDMARNLARHFNLNGEIRKPTAASGT
jgi:transcriptional regulator with XRE-family HTH domain